MKKLSLVILMFLVNFALVPSVRPDDSAPPVDRVSMKQARATALRKSPGKVKDFEFKQKNDKWVYAFKIAGKDQRLHFIIVDALTGKITSKTSEPMPSPPAGSIKATPTAGKSHS